MLEAQIQAACRSLQTQAARAICGRTIIATHSLQSVWKIDKQKSIVQGCERR